ncbi:hypothetical protein Taro_014098 [Colocasia esculenta]|uniref:Uncharacterized protein n=1 Tax=Colocasia esculenta TaxID=4460 RepID=A0A843UDL4_COLES|nr:hypothetical protein [Colocasia esculenta]
MRRLTNKEEGQSYEEAASVEQLCHLPSCVCVYAVTLRNSALFGERCPTPHLVAEITASPAGPVTKKDYTKAERLERVSGSSI